VDRETRAREVAKAAGRPLEELAMHLVPLAGLTGTGLPERMAPLNTILNLLPAATRDQLLAAFVNAL
jgi:hypothetical protein